MKMYRHGVEQERGHASAEGGTGAGAGVGAGLDVPVGGGASAAAPDLDDDWEEEAAELLRWSSSLNFDTYADNWAAIGTSGYPLGPSAGLLTEEVSVGPAYESTVSLLPHSEAAPAPPHDAGGHYAYAFDDGLPAPTKVAAPSAAASNDVFMPASQFYVPAGSRAPEYGSAAYARDDVPHPAY